MMSRTNAARTLGLAAVLLLAKPSAAQVTCGATLGPGVKIVLTGDVGPCTDSTDPAIHVRGPATLDLNGFKILCTGGTPPNGVVLADKKVRLRNGSIHGCNHGVRLNGDGGHQVDNVVVLDSDAHAFDINSSKNRLRDNVARGGTRGFTFQQPHGSNQFKGNVAVGHTFQAFDINGHKSKLSQNLALDSGTSGFYCDGDGNKFSKNRSVGNKHGIEIASGCTKTSIKNNVALGNDTDLEDSDCTNGNKWSKNLFGTSIGPCVK